MQFSYDQKIRNEFPELKTGIIEVDGVSFAGNVSAWTAHFDDLATATPAVREETRHVLIIAERLHDEAREDVAPLTVALRRTMTETWPAAHIFEGRAR
jgi:hypothetical protein